MRARRREDTDEFIDKTDEALEVVLGLKVKSVFPLVLDYSRIA